MKAKFKKDIGIIFICVVLVYISLAALSNLARDFNDKSIGVKDGYIDENDIEKQHQRQIETGDTSKTLIHMSTEISVDYINSTARLAIQNSPYNELSFFVDIINNDTGSVVYESPLIKPGQYIEFDRLKGEFNKGDNNCTAKFYINRATSAKVDLNIHVDHNRKEPLIYFNY